MGTSADSLTLAGVGDAIIARKLRTFDDPGFREIVDRVRGADAAVVNLEILLHDFEGYPTGSRTGTYMRAPPWVADELSWAGFNLFTTASNHSGDYSHGGMEATMRNLEERGLVYAGLGRNLADALSPSYLDTEAGRVGLVNACSTIRGDSAAGRQRQDMQGRPGLAPLRHEARYVLPDREYERLQDICEGLGLNELKADPATSSFPQNRPSDGEGYFEFPNVDGGSLRFEPGAGFAVERRADRDDFDALVEQVERARRQADWVVASLHAHEAPGGRSTEHECAEFVEEFARACIRAGADAFVGHGAHVLQGIEIYEGCPIFYDLGNFVSQNQLIARFPAEMYERYGFDPYHDSPEDIFDARVFDEDGEPKGFLAKDDWWSSVLPVCEFEAGRLQAISLYPLDLQQDAPRPRRGRPTLATGTLAEDVLETLADLSEPYGTTIETDGEVGRVVV